MFAHLKTHDLLSFKVVARGADEGCDCSGCRTDDTRGKAAERQLLRRDHHLVDVWSCRGHLMMRARLGPRGSAPSFVAAERAGEGGEAAAAQGKPRARPPGAPVNSY